TTAQDFSLSLASASLTLQAGGQGADVITIAPQNGSFGNSIQLTCAITGPAPMPTCALSTSSVTPGANAVTSTLSIKAPAAVAMHVRFSRSWLSKPLYALGLPLMFGIAFIQGSNTKRRRYWFVGILLLLLLVLQTACGGSNNKTSPRNYTVTVTGTSGA